MFLSCLRTLIMYLVLVAGVRLMGKRQISQMAPSEFVVTMLISNLASIPIADLSAPFSAGLVPIGAVLAGELLLSGAVLHSLMLRRLLCGKPMILIENGHILQENIRRTRVSIDELTRQLRQKDVLDLRKVQYAILETDGSLSVFPFSRYKPAPAEDAGVPVSSPRLEIHIIEDGRIIPENLRQAGKDLPWLEHFLRDRSLTPEDVWLLSLDGSEKPLLIRRERRIKQKFTKS